MQTEYEIWQDERTRVANPAPFPIVRVILIGFTLAALAVGLLMVGHK